MTRLDGDIVSFSNLQRVTLADGVFGVYVDGLQESGAMVTELIYWEDGQLNAPFMHRRITSPPSPGGNRASPPWTSTATARWNGRSAAA